MCGGRDQVKDDIAKAVGKSEYSEEKAREYCSLFWWHDCELIFLCHVDSQGIACDDQARLA